MSIITYIFYEYNDLIISIIIIVFLINNIITLDKKVIIEK